MSVQLQASLQRNQSLEEQLKQAQYEIREKHSQQEQHTRQLNMQFDQREKMLLAQFDQQEILFKRLKGELEELRAERTGLQSQLEQAKGSSSMLKRADEEQRKKHEALVMRLK